jgi:hypothetical protein
MKKLKLHKFFIGSLDSKYHTKLISDIKNYEAVIHFIIIDIHNNVWYQNGSHL